jgi:spermidine synthase
MNSIYVRTLYLTLIFFTGGVVLSLELISSRILAPFFGVSLYIWTAILSTTLTFLAIGYQMGGWIANKTRNAHNELFLVLLPILSVFFIFLSCLLYPILFPEILSFGLIFGSFIGSFILLAFPLVFLSALNPILIALFSQSSDGKNSISGFVFSLSTVGSVAGVLLTSLIIVPNITNFSFMLINGIFLGLLSIVIYYLTKRNGSLAINPKIIICGITAVILCLSLLIWKNTYLDFVSSSTSSRGEHFKILSEYPSHYGNLKVVGITPKGQKEITRYTLFQNGATHNTITKEGVSLSTYIYSLIRLASQALASLNPEAKSALVLGFGAGEAPSILRKQGKKVTVVDINPNTLTAAKEYFNYKQDGIKFNFGDARTYVKNCKNKFDLIIIDLFHGDGTPDHVTSVEFYEDISECLSKTGILVANLVIGLAVEGAKMSTLSTISSVFGPVHFFHTRSVFNDSDDIKLTNGFIVASNTALPKTFPFLNLILFDFCYTCPDKIRKKVNATVRSHHVYDQESLKKYTLISDHGNSFTSLFASSNMKYREHLASTTPSRILIN